MSSQGACYQVMEEQYSSPEGVRYTGYGIRGEFQGRAVLLADLSETAPKGAGGYVFWLIPDGSGGWAVDDWGYSVFPDL